MNYQAIIIGAGPAGLMAAIEFEKQNINYLLLEKKEKVAKKLFISGGKRCNVTNNLDIDEFINNLTLKNKKFLYPSLYTFGPTDVIRFFNDNDLKLVLENNFKYFPITNRSQSIIDVLLKNINKDNIKLETEVKRITKVEKLFIVKTENKIYKTDNLIVATGSKSFPMTGSTGFGLQIANSFDIKFKDFSPAETHIYSKQIVNNFKDLQGTTIKNTLVKIKNSKIKHQGDLLFTHFGLSGPVIYHLSEFIYESANEPVILEFSLTSKTNHEVDELFNDGKLLILKALEQLVSKRLARKILEILSFENRRISEISKKDLDRIKDTVLRFSIEVSKVEDRDKSYVNKGGILLNELNPNSLETKKVGGLYFIGETVNIHGPIGGYNITIAFATGKLAALDISEKY
ncbi:Ferredoxin--NADP reductase [Candidatus Izimaplasma bacterium HR1]|jgi:predicted Rossmann fold flavoprotein|uniref:NAD(P)/FAD-dependent oxidoreductase n=1 Tax=Candidatus Izimoplasma sp. HR1 TaxID=1541959 RepID=UPI0004F58CA3|nr:Ferredoxin--NADP reductase [Candidatus Izimaplasma bacterium HR1]